MTVNFYTSSRPTSAGLPALTCMTLGFSFVVMALALPQWRLLEQGWTPGAGLASLYFSLWQMLVISAPFLLLDQHEVESPRVRMYYGLAVLAAALYVATQ